MQVLKDSLAQSPPRSLATLGRTTVSVHQSLRPCPGCARGGPWGTWAGTPAPAPPAHLPPWPATTGAQAAPWGPLARLDQCLPGPGATNRNGHEETQ